MKQYLKNKKLYILLPLFVLSILSILFMNSGMASSEEEPVLCTKSDEYIRWEKLSEEEKENTIMPMMCDREKDEINYRYFSFDVKGSLPTTFDLRKQSYAPVLKDQMSTGGCWAFATTTVLETYARKNLNIKDVYSTRHIEYSSTRSFLNNQVNENGYNRNLGSGGNAYMSSNYLINGNGPILESEMPFENNENYIEITKYLGNDEEVEIPSEINGKTVTTLCENLFDVNENVKKLIVPESIINIPYYAFGPLCKLEELIVPFIGTSREKTIALSDFFYGTSAVYTLKKVVVTDAIEIIYNNAEYVETFILNQGIQKIDFGAFNYMKSLKNLVLPSSADIYNFNFYNVNNDLKIFFIGTENEWNSKESNSSYNNIYFYSETQPVIQGNYWHYVDGEPVIWPNVLSYNVNFYVEGILYHTEHVVHEGRLNLPVNPTKEGYNFVGWYYEEYGFMWDSSLYTVIYDMTLTAVFEEIISEYTPFTYNEYDNYVEITEYVGEGEEVVVIPGYINNKPIVLGMASMMSLPLSVKEVIVSEGVTKIGNSAFDKCNFEKITLPSTLVEIDNYAFYMCYNLTINYIPSNVTRIGEQALRGVTLNNVVLKDIDIAYDAFMECNGNIFYYGDEFSWLNKMLNFNYDNVYFYSDTEPTSSGNYWHYVDGEPTIWKRNVMVDLYIVPGAGSNIFDEKYRMTIDDKGNYSFTGHFDKYFEFIVSSKDGTITYTESEVVSYNGVDKFMANLRTLTSGVFYVEIKNNEFNVSLIEQDEYSGVYLVKNYYDGKLDYHYQFDRNKDGMYYLDIYLEDNFEFMFYDYATGTVNANATVISICITTVHQRLVLKISTNGLQNGLIIQGK